MANVRGLEEFVVGILVVVVVVVVVVFGWVRGYGSWFVVSFGEGCWIVVSGLQRICFL